MKRAIYNFPLFIIFCPIFSLFTLQTVPKKSKTTLFRDYLEFNGINRLNKKVVGGQRVGGHQEDEWQSYWDATGDEEEFEPNETFASHLKISEEKSLAKEDIVQVSGLETSSPQESPKKNLTTFAALKNSEQPHNNNNNNKKVENLVVHEDQVNSVTENISITNTSESSSDKSSDEIITENKIVPIDPVTNELKEFVKQRYARRYRSKFPRRKTNLIDEVILEEDEDALEGMN